MYSFSKMGFLGFIVSCIFWSALTAFMYLGTPFIEKVLTVSFMVGMIFFASTVLVWAIVEINQSAKFNDYGSF